MQVPGVVWGRAALRQDREGGMGGEANQRHRLHFQDFEYRQHNYGKILEYLEPKLGLLLEYLERNWCEGNQRHRLHLQDFEYLQHNWG